MHLPGYAQNDNTGKATKNGPHPFEIKIIDVEKKKRANKQTEITYLEIF